MCVDDQYVFHRLLFLNNQWSDAPSHLHVGFGVVGSITLTPEGKRPEGMAILRIDFHGCLLHGEGNYRRRISAEK
jgi:hypothetical protein